MRNNTCDVTFLYPNTARSVYVLHQWSDSPCVRDVSYGLTDDLGAIWVAQGCWAKFWVFFNTGETSSF